MTEESKVQALPHNLIMENRNRLTVSGVSDVDSFDEQTVVIFTQMGEADRARQRPAYNQSQCRQRRAEP